MGEKLASTDMMAPVKEASDMDTDELRLAQMGMVTLPQYQLILLTVAC
jgi:hypothetical protein